MNQTIISPQKLSLLKDSKVFRQIQEKLTQNSLQSYKKARRQFLKKRGQVIVNLNNLNSEEYIRSCNQVLTDAKNEMVENRMKEENESEKLLKILLEDKIKERKLVENPLYQTYDRLLEIQKELNKLKGSEGSEGSKQAVKYQFDQIKAKLKDAIPLDKNNERGQMQSNTLNIKIQNPDNIMAISTKTTNIQFAPYLSRPLSKAQASFDSFVSDGSDLQLNNDQVLGVRHTKQKKEEKPKNTSMPAIDKTEKAKEQTKQIIQTLDKLQNKIPAKKQMIISKKEQTVKQQFKQDLESQSQNSNDSGQIDLDDNAIFKTSEKNKKKSEKKKVSPIKSQNRAEKKVDKETINNNNSKNLAKNQALETKEQKKQITQTLDKLQNKIPANKQMVISKKEQTVKKQFKQDLESQSQNSNDSGQIDLDDNAIFKTSEKKKKKSEKKKVSPIKSQNRAEKKVDKETINNNNSKNLAKNQALETKEQKKQIKKQIQQVKPKQQNQIPVPLRKNKKQDSDDQMTILDDITFHKLDTIKDQKHNEESLQTKLKPKIETQQLKIKDLKPNQNNKKIELIPKKIQVEKKIESRRQQNEGQDTQFMSDSLIGGIKQVKNEKKSPFEGVSLDNKFSLGSLIKQNNKTIFNVNSEPSAINITQNKTVSIFGASHSQNKNTSIFGSKPAQTQPSNLFGSKPVQTQPSNLFGSKPQQYKSSSLFGGTAPSSLFTAKPLQNQSKTQFGVIKTQNKSQSLFGPQKTLNQSPFNLFGANHSQNQPSLFKQNQPIKQQISSNLSSAAPVPPTD